MAPVYLTRVKPCAVHSAGRQGEGAHQGRGCQPSRCGKGKHPKLPQDVSSSPNRLYWHEPTVDHVWPQLAAGKLSPPEKGQPPTPAGVALLASRGHAPHGLATCTTAVALGRSETAVKRSPRLPPTPLPCVRGALVTVRGSEKNHPQQEETAVPQRSAVAPRGWKKCKRHRGRTIQPCRVCLVQLHRHVQARRRGQCSTAATHTHPGSSGRQTEGQPCRVHKFPPARGNWRQQ